jgi:hypothetical protein
MSMLVYLLDMLERLKARLDMYWCIISPLETSLMTTHRIASSNAKIEMPMRSSASKDTRKITSDFKGFYKKKCQSFVTNVVIELTMKMICATNVRPLMFANRVAPLGIAAPAAGMTKEWPMGLAFAPIVRLEPPAMSVTHPWMLKADRFIVGIVMNEDINEPLQTLNKKNVDARTHYSVGCSDSGGAISTVTSVAQEISRVL